MKCNARQTLSLIVVSQYDFSRTGDATLLLRKQTVESIQKLHAKEDEESTETAKAATALEQQMKRLRLEVKLLCQADER